MPPLNLLLVFALFLIFFPLPKTHSIAFHFTSFNIRNLTLLGDSHLRGGAIRLTKDLAVPSSSAGAAIYNKPIPFYDPDSGTTASFSTSFSFSITNINPTPSGDGLSFFLSANNRTLGSAGGYLGLLNSSHLTKNKFVAVEFDTRLDSLFNDPNAHHVGFDIGTLVSIQTADPVSQGVNLKSGKLITSWIEYNNEESRFRVFLSYSGFKPSEALLDVHVDLSSYLKEVMYVGFSGSTEGSTELHLIASWSFSTSGFVPARPTFNPHHVSDISVIVSPHVSVSDSGNGHPSRLGLGLGIAGPGLFCAVIVVFGFFLVGKWRKVRIQKSFKAELLTGPREFSYRELEAATKGFHYSRIVGSGAFGTVYKAVCISSGTMSAVKRSNHSREGETEFLAELSIIAQVRHKNLVPLQGWCTEKDELLLVYDFMPNGSLDRLLYLESGEASLLKWSHRYNIAVGLASVLTYLHQECEQQVIHRDIKTGNVLLDGNFNARLSDFGLAKLMDHDKTPDSTLTAGTMGYLAPEYLQYGKATEKTDVFSYGVVILEVACGRRPIQREAGTKKMVNLVDWVWGLHSRGKIMEAADKRLKRKFREEEMRKVLLVGLSCANPDSSARPSMRKVLQILNNEGEPVFVPKMKPSLTFSCGFSLSLDDMIAEEGGGRECSKTTIVQID